MLPNWLIFSILFGWSAYLWVKGALFLKVILPYDKIYEYFFYFFFYLSISNLLKKESLTIF